MIALFFVGRPRFSAQMMLTIVLKTMLQNPPRVLIFPEGTTTDGTALIHFKYVFNLYHPIST